MKRSLTLFVLACCTTFAWSQVPPQTSPSTPPASTAPLTGPAVRGPEAVSQKNPDKIVATINGKQITAKQAAELLKMVPPDQRRNAPSLERLFEQLYVMSDLAQLAQQEHLEQSSPVKEQLQLSRDNILAQAYMTRLAGSSTQPGGDPKQYYDAHPDEFDSAKLSGIAISFNPPGTPATGNGPNRTEQEAQQKADDLEKKIKAGADITTLARTDSDDQRSAAQGGSLGTLTAAQPNVPNEIKDVVFHKLQAGQVSEPIRLPNAFYIIKVDSRSKQPFDQAKDGIAQKMSADKNQAIVKQELDKYKVQVQDPDFFNTGNSASPSAKIPSLNHPAGTSGPAADATAPKSAPPK